MQKNNTASTSPPLFSSPMVHKNFLYQDERGMLTIPLVLLWLRMEYALRELTLKTTTRGCVIPDYPEAQRPRLLKEHGIFISKNGYWCLRLHNTIVGLHALYWAYQNKRHPKPGMRVFYECLSWP